MRFLRITSKSQFVMHPDLSPHLHTDECNKLVQELFACRKDVSIKKSGLRCFRVFCLYNFNRNSLFALLFATQNLFLKFFGKCNTPYDRMLACMKQERLARRAKNAENARKKQELVRERVKQDKTDYDELLKQYRKEGKPN